MRLNSLITLLLAATLSLSCANTQAQDAVYWRVTASGIDSKGLRLLEGADGVPLFETRGGARCAVNRPGVTPASQYLYFDIADATARRLTAPLYVSVEYYDERFGSAVQLQYDSTQGDTLAAKYRDSDEQAGGWRTGMKRWRTAIFRLQNPRFANRQNLGADFRLGIGGLAVRSVRLSSKRPANWEEAHRIDMSKFKPLVKIGKGGELIIGGFDPARRGDERGMVRQLASVAPMLKAIGVTSHEGYVRWNLCELEPGKYDWSVYDAFVKVYKQFGLKWVPFLIIGSPYSLPDWYYKKPGSQGYVCLEHGQESDVQSLWNPELRRHVARFIKAFCERYRDENVIESILLGVTGNYGEAIYIASGNDWTADIHGPYHTHAGFWAGDPYAVESFRVWLIKKYGGRARLRDAWGEAAPPINEVRPFLRQDAPNERAWLDFCDWYIGSMTEYARFWAQETRKHFSGPINLCTGGHAPPEHGANFGDQCKLMAEIGGGVRITNEGSDYRANFSLTRWVASAGRQYGAYFSFEPAGAVDPKGVIARIYNATASAARGLHYYYPNLFEQEEAQQNFIRFGDLFQQRQPIVEIAVYYPQTHIKLRGNDFLRFVQPLRDRFDFDFMSDEQILDVGLKRTKALILLHGNISEERVWREIAEWVRQGGLLFYVEGMGRLRTVEGNESIHRNLIEGASDRGKGRVISFSGRGDSREYRAFLARELSQAQELSPASREMVRADGEEDDLFVTLCAPNTLLWLNYSAKTVQKPGIVLAPYSIQEQKR